MRTSFVPGTCTRYMYRVHVPGTAATRGCHHFGRSGVMGTCPDTYRTRHSRLSAPYRHPRRGRDGVLPQRQGLPRLHEIPARGAGPRRLRPAHVRADAEPRPLAGDSRSAKGLSPTMMHSVGTSLRPLLQCGIRAHRPAVRGALLVEPDRDRTLLLRRRCAISSSIRFAPEWWIIPGRYPWSSYLHNTGRERREELTFHDEYLGLGRTPAECATTLGRLRGPGHLARSNSPGFASTSGATVRWAAPPSANNSRKRYRTCTRYMYRVQNHFLVKSPALTMVTFAGSRCLRSAAFTSATVSACSRSSKALLKANVRPRCR